MPRNAVLGRRGPSSLPAPSDHLTPEPVVVTEVEDRDQPPQQAIQFGYRHHLAGGLEPGPQARSYAATRGAADPATAPRPSSRSEVPTAFPVATFRPTAFSPGRMRLRGRARRPSCNQQVRRSRRSRAPSASPSRSRSPSRDDPDPPGEPNHLDAGATP